MTAARSAASFTFGTLAIAACVLSPTPADATTPDTVEVFWSMPNNGTPENVTYPQTYSPDGAVTPGVCYQIDRYSSTDAAQFTADNTLFEGEDWADVNGPGTGVLSWRFECVPAAEVIAPVATPEPTTAPAPVAADTRDTAADSQASTKPTTPELAHTGPDSPWLLPGGLALVLAGFLLIRAPFRAVQKKRESK